METDSLVNMALAFAQIVFFPSIVFLFKYHSKVSNEKIEAQREVTGLKRDAETKETRDMIKDVHIRLDKHEVQDQHKEEENSRTMESMCKAIEKIGNKVDKLYNKAFNIE
jgi:hypothetical protein